MADVNAIIKTAWIDDAGDAKRANGIDLFSINSAIMKYTGKQTIVNRAILNNNPPKIAGANINKMNKPKYRNFRYCKKQYIHTANAKSNKNKLNRSLTNNIE